MEKYDVIVVGAGNGGLSCAATAAKGGLKVLLLEKHNLPGGCATSFVRGRFEFEPALHELCSVGTEEHPDAIYSIFDSLGAKVDWCYETNLFRTIVKGENGWDITLNAGKEGFIESFEKACPGNRKALEKLFELQEIDNEATAYITEKKGNPNKMVMAMKYGDFMRMASYSMEDVLRDLGMDEKAVNLMCTYWGYLGVPTDEVKAFHYLNMMTSYIKDHAAMPRHRSHELSLALAQVVLDHGGDVWYNARVTRFLYNEDGTAKGVELSNGQQVFADEIVSNIIPNNVSNMSPSECVPERTKRLMNARSFGISTVMVYLGLDCTMQELGLEDYTTFISGSPTAREQYNNRDMYIVNCLNKVIPDSSPEGTCTLFFTALVEGSDLPKDMTPRQYKEFKLQMAEKYITDAEQVLHIDIRSHIEEIEIATPVTIARYIGSPDGTIYGYRTSGWDNIMARIASEQQDITVKNLNYVGGHSVRGDGYSCAYITGNNIGKRLVKKHQAAEGKEA